MATGTASPPVRVPVEEIAAYAVEVDRAARFPRESIDALRFAGLLGLGVPESYGGPGGGPAEVARAIEEVAAACASTGMVYTMHLVAAQTLLAGTNGDGVKAETLRAIAAGEHLSTLAYSESGSRSHFWAQVSRAAPANGGVRIDADKSWITSASAADSYIAATGAAGSDDPIETELYLIDAGADGIEVVEPFDGLGMRGNDSSPVRFRGVLAPEERRLGEPRSGFALMMSATLPWFVLGSAACCLGVAGAALVLATDHVSGVRFAHLGTTLAELPTVRARLAEAELRYLQARAYLYTVAEQIAAGAPEAKVGVLALKAVAAEAAIDVTDAAMRVCGGAAYSRHLPLERLFRDARAATVMAPTTDVLLDLLGKSMTGQELF
jgi:alkylation response protein AidB-like acyl-CoA dehydrogenase